MGTIFTKDDVGKPVTLIRGIGKMLGKIVGYRARTNEPVLCEFKTDEVDQFVVASFTAEGAYLSDEKNKILFRGHNIRVVVMGETDRAPQEIKPETQEGPVENIGEELMKATEGFPVMDFIAFIKANEPKKKAPEKPISMDIKKFVDDGYLQEVNRRFFHPLGLAMAAAVNGDGKYELSGILDYREDPTGIHFGPIDLDRVDTINKYLCITRRWENRAKTRKPMVQEIGDSKYKGADLDRKKICLDDGNKRAWVKKPFFKGIITGFKRSNDREIDKIKITDIVDIPQIEEIRISRWFDIDQVRLEVDSHE